MNALQPAAGGGGTPRGWTAAPAIERLQLRDGRSVLLRPVQADDATAEQRFIQALSPRSRLLRFHGALNLLPDTVLRAMTRIDQRSHVALVAETTTDDGLPRLVADARYVVDTAAPSSADFAVAVADDWQRSGLARRLLQRLAEHARLHGVRQLHGSVMVGNEAMLALMRQLGARLEGVAGDASTVMARLSA